MNDEAIPAATLILVRETGRGPPELLMVERAGGMAFAAGALVFPGGRIDEADRELGEAVGISAAEIAAIRETVEETAVPAALSPVPPAEGGRALQDALVGDRPFADLLRESRLTIDAEALTPFARWVPKFHAVRRFDTMFFIARCPSGDWQPRVVEGECSGACWLTAAAVLEREARGDARLIFPTRRNLERLAQHSWVEEIAGERFITIPDHLGYPVTREKLDGLWRG